MNTKEEINRVLEQLGCADYSKYSFNELMQQYDTLKALESFENTPTQFFPSPYKKSKEIALDVAMIINKKVSSINAQSVIEDATIIYKWLITDDYKQQ